MTTKYLARCFIAVPAAQQAAANAACESVVKGGRGTFTVQWPLQDDTGAVLPRYYVCNWQMLPAERTALAAAFLAAGVTATFYDCDSYDPVLSTVKYSAVDADLTSKTAPKGPSLAQRAVLPELDVAAHAVAVPWWRRWWVWFLTFLRRLLGRRPS